MHGGRPTGEVLRQDHTHTKIRYCKTCLQTATCQPPFPIHLSRHQASQSFRSPSSETPAHTMASFTGMVCLVATLVVSFSSTCHAAMVYGSSVKTSPYVGLSGNLSDVAHLMKDQTIGMLTIVSDSAFEVTNWTYTGMAPSVHWVTAMSTSPADLEKYMLLNPDRVTMNYTMADVIVPVSSNVSWANTPIIALYCTQYKALFGSVNLKQELAMKMSGMAMAPSMSMTAVTTGGRKMI